MLCDESRSTRGEGGGMVFFYLGFSLFYFVWFGLVWVYTFLLNVLSP